MKNKLRYSLLLSLLMIVLGPQLFAQSMLYTIDPFNDSLYVLDTADLSAIAQSLPLNSTQGTFTSGNGIAVAPNGCDMYTIVKLSGASGRYLATIDPTTGEIDTIGNTGENIANITFHADGRLFGVSGDGGNTGETLFEIDLATAAITSVATLGAGNDGECIEYCEDDSMIYHWSGRTGGAMEKVNPNTGAITSITRTGFDYDEVFGAVYIGGGEFILTNLDQEVIIVDTTGFAVLDTTGTLAQYHRGSDFYSTAPNADFTVSSDSTCIGNSLTFTSDFACNDSVVFDLGDGTVASMDSVSHTYSNTGTFTVMHIAIRGGVQDTVTSTVEVLALPNVTLTPPDTAYLCGPNDSVSLAGPGGGTNQWFMNGAMISGATADNYTASMPGIYNLWYTDGNGCADSAATGVEVIPAPPVVASFTQSADTVCQDSVISFSNASMGFSTLTWTFGDGNGSAMMNPTHSYSTTGTFTVTLQASGDCGDSTVTSTVEVITCGVGINEPTLPGFTLSHYPNPAKDQTTFVYDLPRAGKVQLTVLDMLGSQVKVLVNESENAGAHQVNWNLSSLESGVYFYRLEFEGHVFTRRMVVNK